jgi:hypothetical protein
MNSVVIFISILHESPGSERLNYSSKVTQLLLSLFPSHWAAALALRLGGV